MRGMTIRPASQRFMALALVCFLLGSLAVLTGCLPKGRKKEAEVSPLELKVLQVDRLLRLEDKVSDGQYLVVKISMENLSKKTIEVTEKNFLLENITTKEDERYSQPAEKNMGKYFGRAYGSEVQDKLLKSVSLYPRLIVERYLIFMVPEDVLPEEYQITYKVKKQPSLTVPLVDTNTVVNDKRHAQ